MTNRAKLFAGTAMMLLCAPLPVLAQTVPSPTTEAVELDEIIVTASRRSERLVDVPQSVTAVTAEDLARLNATQLRDYAAAVPGLTVSSGGGVGQNRVTLRGVTSGEDVASTVGVYVDDVPYGGSTVYSINAGLALDAGLFDLERIEVLRGPQGTLYGSSSMGGLLKYVTPRPDLNRFGGTAQAGVSTTEGGGTSYNLAAAVNAPIATDRFAVRASGFYSRDGGFVENVALGEDDVGRARIYGGRLDALFKPTDRLSVRLSGFSQNISRDGTAQVDYTLAGAPSTGDLEQRRLLREPFEQQFRVVSGTVDYELDWASLTSITSYQTNDVNYRTDASALYVPLLGLFGLPVAAAANDGGIATEKFTQEVRLASSGEGKVDWLLGAFYTDEDNTAQTALVGYNADGSLFPVNLLTASFPSTYKEKAVFGNVTVHLSDRLDVTGGLRYAENRQSYTQNATGILAPSAPRATSSENVTTYLANARYRFSPHTIGYARFATGYRPGGPNLVTFDPLTGNPLGPPTFESDTLKSYELGLRTETSDRRFSVDASAYHIDWEDMLISGVRNGLNSFVNTGGSTIDGAEVTLTARPTSRFTVTGAFAYQDARLSADSPDLGGVDGEALPTVPDLTATVNADYRADWWGMSPTLGATVRYVSDREAGFDGNPNLPQYDLGNYTAVDLRAGATVGPVVAQLYVRNLFDERGQSAAYVALASLGGPARVTVIQPRTIGLSLTSRF